MAVSFDRARISQFEGVSKLGEGWRRVAYEAWCLGVQRQFGLVLHYNPSLRIGDGVDPSSICVEVFHRSGDEGKFVHLPDEQVHFAAMVAHVGRVQYAHLVRRSGHLMIGGLVTTSPLVHAGALFHHSCARRMFLDEFRRIAFAVDNPGRFADLEQFDRAHALLQQAQTGLAAVDGRHPACRDLDHLHGRLRGLEQGMESLQERIREKTAWLHELSNLLSPLGFGLSISSTGD